MKELVNEQFLNKVEQSALKLKCGKGDLLHEVLILFEDLLLTAKED